MKKNNILKAFLLLAIMTLGFAMPMMAQTDGFFRTTNDYTNRAEYELSGTLIPQTFGQDTGNITTQQFGSTPLGSGLLIMVAAGAGYAAVRRKRARKGITLLLAVALLLGTTQCKKKITSLTSNNGGGTLITLNIEDNSKHHIVTTGEPFPNGALGTIEWEKGDIIWVISAGAPVGMLEYDGSSFVGVIGPGNAIDSDELPTIGEPLHFCFTGNLFPDDTTWTIDISDQKDNMPVLSCGVSNETYPSEGNVYTAFMENKCALVKFTLDSGTTDDIRISDMIVKAQLVVTGSGVDILPTNTRGSMVLNMPDSEKPAERWAVILPQAKVTDGNALVRYTKYTGAVKVPRANANGYIPNAAITFSGATTSTVEPYFSIGDGKIVNFAPGNLQYKASGEGSGFRFAENQWDFVGGTDPNNKSYGNVYEGGVKSSNNNISSGYTGWIDLFGWGTGDRPTTIDQDYTHYFDFYDWGNYVTTGGYTWFTLNKDEYEYLINNKTSHAVRENKIAPAKVHDVGGVVILPDFFDMTDHSFNVIDNQLNHMDSIILNVYTDPAWEALESAGAVFLPAAGDRGYYNGQVTYGNDEKEYYPNIGLFKGYWSRTDKGKNSSVAGYALYARNAMWVEDFYRYQGLSVRLVHEVEF